jgi:hypothetical protein
MIVATHGRSIWILDDMKPLQQYAEASKTDAFLFDMRGAMQFNPANDRGFLSDKPFFGKNPTYGAAISYYLSKSQKSVALRIRDASGTQVREISGNDMRDGLGAGVNRIHWDLRHQPLTPPAGVPAGGGGGGGGFGGGGNNGPNVMPGEYRVTLVVDGKEVATKPVRVSGDKDMPMTDAERKTWHDTALNLHDLQRVANSAAESVITLAAQLTTVETLLKAASSPPGAAKAALSDAQTKLGDLRRRLGLNPPQGGGGGGFGAQQGNVRGQLGQVKGQVMNSTSMPTEQQVRSARELRDDMEKVIADTNALIAAVPAIYDALGATGVKPAALKPVGPLPAAR